MVALHNFLQVYDVLFRIAQGEQDLLFAFDPQACLRLQNDGASASFSADAPHNSIALNSTVYKGVGVSPFP